MDLGDTQLIDDSPQRSPSRSSVSGESTGSDGPLHEPTQLLYTQLLDQYEGHMDGSRKTQQLEMAMETQLIDEHNFDDFRKNEGLIMPSEDEATQLVHGDEVHSGSSSGKDGEVDSALSPLNAAYRQNSHWLSEFTHRDRSIEGAAGRASQATFQYRDGYLGDTQILSDDEHCDAHVESRQEQRNFGETRAGCTDLQNRDGDVPHFLRDFDHNRRDYAAQRTLGSWHEVVGQSDGCNEDDRGWDTSVRGLELVDSDASTEDDDENVNTSVFNTEVSCPREAQSSQNLNTRLSTHVSSNFCNQDLNKSPEPEAAMDEWEEGNRIDIDLERCNEDPSDVALLRVDEVDPGCPSQSTPIESRTSEGFNGRTTRATPSTSRTAGSIRAASLRASGLRASSCSSSGRYQQCTPQGSKSEEVQKVEPEATVEMPNNICHKVGGLFGDRTATSRLAMDRGGPSSSASFLSGLSSSSRETDSPMPKNEVLEAEKVMKYSDAATKEGSRAGTYRWGEPSSALGLEVPKLAEKNPSRVRQLFLGKGKEVDKGAQSSEDRNLEPQWGPSTERVDVGKTVGAETLPPRENHSSPVEKSLERRSSFGSGLFSTGSEMSYLNLQSPGEDSQAKALNMVDKLVWLNAIGLPQELQLEEDKAPTRGPLNAKSALQSRVQVAEAKAGRDDPFGVFDWVDSQHDEAGMFFGGGNTKANPGKGTFKPSNAVGQLKQSGFGSKKGGMDVVGGRDKKVEKLPEKGKSIKPMLNTDKAKALASKNLSAAMENKREQQGGRSRSRSGATDIRQEPGCIERALDLDLSRKDRVGNVTNKQSGPSDTGLKNLGANDNIFTSDKAELVPTVRVPQQQRGTNLAEQARSKRLSNDTGLTYIRNSLKASNDLTVALDVEKGKGDKMLESQSGEPEILHNGRQPSGLSQPHFGTDGINEAKATVVAKASGFNADHALQEIGAQDTMKDGDCMHDVGDADFSHDVMGNIVTRNMENMVERVPTIWEKAPTNGKTVDNAKDLANLPQGLQFSALQEQSHGNSANTRDQLRRIGKYPGSAELALDGTKVPLVVSYSTFGQSGHGDDCSLATVTVPLTDQPEHSDLLATFPTQDVHNFPDTEGAIKTIDLEKGNRTPLISEGVVREDRIENVAIISEFVSMRDDMEDGRKPKIEEEMQSVPKKKQMATRRGRSQTKHSAKLLGNTDPPGRSKDLIRRDKGRGRRVTWAGPLEQVPSQSIGLRSRRSLKQRNDRLCEDAADSTADSSGQEEEEVEDTKEEPRTENGSRKRISDALERFRSRDNDVDKIKRRFNMSDAAVARLLGTDEEEDAEIDQATAVKVRCLSHIQPEADENEVMANPNTRRFGKGLRSVRSRGEEGGRRPKPVVGTDQERLDGEEFVLRFDQIVGQGNMDGTNTMETHPSDNEAASGRRRMRSIADVSFPNLLQITPGRPPAAQGVRRRRARNVKSPPEAKADPSDDDLSDVPPSLPASVSPTIGRLRGKGGPRSVRKRKDPEPDYVPAIFEVNISPNPSKENMPMNFKRRKRTGSTSVLLSHGLNEETIKKQRKIVAKLGGRVATSSSDCSHFVADKFVRTGNMLEAMASGKPVVNIHWLETCSEANRFIDEQEFILQDLKKEEEMGFSMISTLANARQRPLLQGIRVYITPGTSPGPDSLARIVKSAGGQVMDGYLGPSADGEQESDFCVVISSEEELDDCIPLLEQGAKVYTPELLLSGVTSYHLDFSNDQLFANFVTRRRRGSSSRRTVA